MNYFVGDAPSVLSRAWSLLMHFVAASSIGCFNA